MSALGPDHIPDVVDAMAGESPKARRSHHSSFVVHWRKKAGLLYYEKQTNGRYFILRHGVKAVGMDYATLAGARGRIAWEARREKEAKQDAA